MSHSAAALSPRRGGAGANNQKILLENIEQIQEMAGGNSVTALWRSESEFCNPSWVKNNVLQECQLVEHGSNLTLDVWSVPNHSTAANRHPRRVAGCDFYDYKLPVVKTVDSGPMLEGLTPL
eukprot:PhF_6_TR6434/c0_g1_i1/m.9660